MAHKHLALVNLLLVATLIAVVGGSARSAEPSKEEASKALRKAVNFFRKEVSASGGYLWRYSSDLGERAGERPASATTAWVQPPGTPSVGEAYLTAYRWTKDPYYLEAARETAHALVAGQLKSGGWDYRIEYDPEDRRRYAYRSDGDRAGDRNVSTLDDDTTQSALRFLMRADEALDFQDRAIHEAVEYGLNALLEVQYPNGAWPQRFTEPPDPDEYPIKPASYPETWSRTHPDHDYRGYYTFNDNTIADTIETMFLAAEIYDDDRYHASAKRAGDFIVLAQMPDPQPAWAQQYNPQMQPAWARRFEPPSVTGGESQGVMRVLMDIYRKTGDKKYLEPLPRALEYLKSSRLPDGRLARFYELKTNRPLYFTKDYELTYSSDDMPTHYSFIQDSRLDRIEEQYRRLLESGPDRGDSREQAERVVRMTPDLARRAERVIDAADERGAWVEDGRISTRDFMRNMEMLARFIAASQ